MKKKELISLSGQIKSYDVLNFIEEKLNTSKLFYILKNNFNLCNI